MSDFTSPVSAVATHHNYRQIFVQLTSHNADTCVVRNPGTGQALWQQHRKWKVTTLATDLVKVNLVTSCFPETARLTLKD